MKQNNKSYNTYTATKTDPDPADLKSLKDF